MDGQQDAFEELLERIRRQEHPEYGCISWDGASREFTVTIPFERNGQPEPDEVVRARALRYLESLSQAERSAANIEVTFKNYMPVKAVLRGKTGDLDPRRLAELERKMKM